MLESTGATELRRHGDGTARSDTPDFMSGFPLLMPHFLPPNYNSIVVLTLHVSE